MQELTSENTLLRESLLSFSSSLSQAWAAGGVRQKPGEVLILRLKFGGTWVGDWPDGCRRVINWLGEASSMVSGKGPFVGIFRWWFLRLDADDDFVGAKELFCKDFCFHRNVTTWWQIVTKERSQMPHVDIFWQIAVWNILNKRWKRYTSLTWWFKYLMDGCCDGFALTLLFAERCIFVPPVRYRIFYMNVNEHEDPNKHIRIACFVIWSTSYLQHSFLEDLGGIECWNFWRTVCFNDVVPRVFLPFAFQAIKNWRAFWPPSLPTQSVPCPWLSRLSAMNH